MKVVKEGQEEPIAPHFCRSKLWAFEEDRRASQGVQVNRGTIVECGCGAQWRLQRALGVAGVVRDFFSWNRPWYTSCLGESIWMRIKKGKKWAGSKG